MSLLACHALHIMSSCAFHLHTSSSHASEHFPRCPFCNPALLCHPVSLSTFFSCVGVKHFRIGPRLAKQPWFTTGRPSVKFRIIWTSSDTSFWPKTHQNPLHHLERSITIAWPKTAPHLDSPRSLYVYLNNPPPKFSRRSNPSFVLRAPPDMSAAPQPPP